MGATVATCFTDKFENRSALNVILPAYAYTLTPEVPVRIQFFKNFTGTKDLIYALVNQFEQGYVCLGARGKILATIGDLTVNTTYQQTETALTCSDEKNPDSKCQGWNIYPPSVSNPCYDQSP